MDYRDKKPRYKGICPVCGKTNWICKSIAMELGVNTGIGHCLGCNTFLNVKFNEERQEMDLSRAREPALWLNWPVLLFAGCLYSPIERVYCLK